MSFGRRSLPPLSATLPSLLSVPIKQPTQCFSIVRHGRSALQATRGLPRNRRINKQNPSPALPVCHNLAAITIQITCQKAFAAVLAAAQGAFRSGESPGSAAMHVFSVVGEAEFNPKKHVEKILGKIGDGDVTVACWEPGQISPYHCHPHATEIYFCFEGGGVMRTPRRNDRRRARRLRRPSARRGARIRKRGQAHAAVPRPLRRRHGLRAISTGAAATVSSKAPKTRIITGAIRSTPDRRVHASQTGCPHPSRPVRSHLWMHGTETSDCRLNQSRATTQGRRNTQGMRKHGCSRNRIAR